MPAADLTPVRGNRRESPRRVAAEPYWMAAGSEGPLLGLPGHRARGAIRQLLSDDKVARYVASVAIRIPEALSATAVVGKE
jgi:hypothetical protein